MSLFSTHRGRLLKLVPLLLVLGGWWVGSSTLSHQQQVYHQQTVDELERRVEIFQAEDAQVKAYLDKMQKEGEITP